MTNEDNQIFLGVQPWAMNADFAEQLWAKSEQWAGASFTA
jgi:hypothetical protein